MIKSALLSVFVFAGIVTVSGQTTPASITINKKIQPGLVLDLPNDTEAAKGTILQKLKETGYSPETTGELFWKKNKVDGFYYFKGVQLPALDNQKLDMYFKVAEKSKSRKNESTISMLVSKGYDNFISAESDTATFAAATNFLNGFLSGTATYSLNQDIQQQEKTIQDAEKKLTGIKGDTEATMRKIESLQAELRNQQNDFAMQEKEVATQKAKLEELKAKAAVK
jgi:hypothetical protein